MKDIDDLIELILGDEKLRESKTLGEKIYRDEPILRPASQLLKQDESRKSPAPSEPYDPKETNLPKRLMEMRRMTYSPEAQWKSREWLFNKQGRYMEDYEDDFDKEVRFDKYYPTYSDMSLEQQRAYFSWRTKVRRGEFPDTCLSFMFVYAYELINLIGVKTPQEGYDKLKALAENCGESQPKLKKYLGEWLYDMVIYYGLDSSLTADNELREFDSAITVLRDIQGRSRDEIFSALCVMSSYNAERSAFCKAYPEDFSAVAVGSWLALAEYYKTHRKHTLFEKYFGKRVCSVHRMFGSAVFCHYRTVKHTSVSISEVRRYIFRHGEWYCEEYVGKPRSNKQVGEFLRAVDSIMRRRYSYPKELQQPDVIKVLVKMIEQEIDDLAEEKKRAEAMRVEIDLSKLGSIRRAADITRDKLIVEEESDELPLPSERRMLREVRPDKDEAADMSEQNSLLSALHGTSETPAPLDAMDTAGLLRQTEPEPRTEVHSTARNDTPLNDGEYAFLRALLYDGDYSAAAKNAGSMPSLMADSVNEKLYDIFADTVIEFDGETPVIIEDYEDELKGMIL